MNRKAYKTIKGIQIYTDKLMLEFANEKDPIKKIVLGQKIKDLCEKGLSMANK